MGTIRNHFISLFALGGVRGLLSASGAGLSVYHGGGCAAGSRFWLRASGRFVSPAAAQPLRVSFSTAPPSSVSLLGISARRSGGSAWCGCDALRGFSGVGLVLFGGSFCPLPGSACPSSAVFPLVLFSHSVGGARVGAYRAGALVSAFSASDALSGPVTPMCTRPATTIAEPPVPPTPAPAQQPHGPVSGQHPVLSALFEHVRLSESGEVAVCGCRPSRALSGGGGAGGCGGGAPGGGMLSVDGARDLPAVPVSGRSRAFAELSGVPVPGGRHTVLQSVFGAVAVCQVLEFSRGCAPQPLLVLSSWLVEVMCGLGATVGLSGLLRAQGRVAAAMGVDLPDATVRGADNDYARRALRAVEAQVFGSDTPATGVHIPRGPKRTIRVIADMHSLPHDSKALIALRQCVADALRRLYISHGHEWARGADKIMRLPAQWVLRALRHTETRTVFRDFLIATERLSDWHAKNTALRTDAHTPTVQHAREGLARLRSREAQGLRARTPRLPDSLNLDGGWRRSGGDDSPHRAGHGKDAPCTGDATVTFADAAPAAMLPDKARLSKGVAKLMQWAETCGRAHTCPGTWESLNGAFVEVITRAVNDAIGKGALDPGTGSTQTRARRVRRCIAHATGLSHPLDASIDETPEQWQKDLSENTIQAIRDLRTTLVTQGPNLTQWDKLARSRAGMSQHEELTELVVHATGRPLLRKHLDTTPCSKDDTTCRQRQKRYVVKAGKNDVHGSDIWRMVHRTTRLFGGAAPAEHPDAPPEITAAPCHMPHTHDMLRIHPAGPGPLPPAMRAEKPAVKPPHNDTWRSSDENTWSAMGAATETTDLTKGV